MATVGPQYYDRVYQLSTATGNGNFKLGNTPKGYLSFADAIGTGKDFEYVIEAVDRLGVPSGVFEVGQGQIIKSGNDYYLRRDTVLKNHLGTTAKVSFGTGDKNVWCDVSAKRFNEYQDALNTAVSEAEAARDETVAKLGASTDAENKDPATVWSLYKATTTAKNTAVSAKNTAVATLGTSSDTAGANTVYGQAKLATNKASEASTSASNALTYKNAAETAKNTAVSTLGSSSDAAGAATVYGQAKLATNKASAASTSESNAQTYMQNAQGYASTASTKASEASTSASSASTSASNASSSATTASQKASAASTSATNAANSATAAANSATAAANSATQAQQAKDSVVTAVGTPVAGTGIALGELSAQNTYTINVKNEYLKLAGGTMTGQIKTSYTDVLVKTTDDGHLTIVGGSAYANGASIQLTGKSETNTTGRWQLRAQDGTNQTNLIGYPTGELNWNSAIYIRNNNISRASTGNWLRLNGGQTDYTDGASLVLYGKTHSSNAGCFNLSAFDGTNRYGLSGNASTGILSWNGSVYLPNNGVYGADLTSQTVDLNDCYSSISGAVKLFHCNTDGGAGNISNYPEKKAFLLVSYTARYLNSSDYVVHQHFYCIGAHYSRRCTSGTWTAWTLDVTSSSASVGDANTPLYLSNGVLTSTGKSFANYLPLSGGKLTGNLVNNAGYYSDFTEYERGTAPSSSTFRSLQFRDKSGNAIGKFQMGVYDSGTNQLHMVVNRPDTGNEFVGIRVCSNTSGTNFIDIASYIRRDGNFSINTSDTTWVRFNAGTTDDTGGANLLLYGKSHSSSAGVLRLKAYDGTNISTVQVFPNAITQFSRGIQIGGETISASNIRIRNANLTRGTAPSANQNHELTYQDKNGGTMSSVVFQYNTSKRHGVYLEPCNDSATRNGILGIFMDAAGTTAYTQAPTPAQTDDSTKIATTAYVKDCVPKSVGDTNTPVYVDADGVVTSTGKSFANYLPLSGGTMTGNIAKKSGLTKGTNPSSTTWHTDFITLDNGGTATANRLFELRSAVDSNGYNFLDLRAYDFTSGSSDANTLTVGKLLNGVKRTDINSAVIRIEDHKIMRNSTNGWMRLTGGSTDNSGGGSLLLYGKEASSHEGQAILQAHNGTNYTNLTLNATSQAVLSTALKVAGGNNAIANTGLTVSGTNTNYSVKLQSTGFTKGTSNATTYRGTVEFYGNTMSKWQDRAGMLEFNVVSNKSTAQLVAYNVTAAENTSTCAIGATVDASGNAATFAPTPAAGDNSTKIATTAWVTTAVTKGANMPPGTIVEYAGTSAPSGWLYCNGAAVSRTTYAALFSAIGTGYGTGNGSSTFNLPDFRDRVPQGGSSATDRGNIAAGLPNITGYSHSGKGGFSLYSDDNPFYRLDPNVVTGSGEGNKSEGYTEGFDASRANSIYGNSTTVQPPAVKVMFIIKT